MTPLTVLVPPAKLVKVMAPVPEVPFVFVLFPAVPTDLAYIFCVPARAPREYGTEKSTAG